ncbi:MAG: CDP-alcohol phosphatidyltransferase family protein [Clostridia bacterium]|nr:CDP-alcohol phosphatidyltransferase family protein [Clostridia bacterium]
MKETLKDLTKNMWTVPNLLSFIRILLVPLFAVLFMKEQYVWSIIVLALSGLSDFFDGKIARKFNQVSALGKILDPVADKLTQITIAIVFYITFAGSSDKTVKAFSWIFLIFLIKEAVMVVGGAIMIATGLKPGAAELPGKIGTFAFYLIMISIMAFGPDIGICRNVFTYPAPVMIVLVCISAILTLVAFSSYVPGVWRQIQDKKKAKAEAAASGSSGGDSSEEK